MNQKIKRTKKSKHKDYAKQNRPLEKTPVSADLYDLLVLGSGEAGKYIAWTQAKKGMQVAVIEQKYVGGFLSKHCLSSKQEYHP